MPDRQRSGTPHSLQFLSINPDTAYIWILSKMSGTGLMKLVGLLTGKRAMRLRACRLYPRRPEPQQDGRSSDLSLHPRPSRTTPVAEITDAHEGTYSSGHCRRFTRRSLDRPVQIYEFPRQNKTNRAYCCIPDVSICTRCICRHTGLGSAGTGTAPRGILKEKSCRRHSSFPTLARSPRPVRLSPRI